MSCTTSSSRMQRDRCAAVSVKTVSPREAPRLRRQSGVTLGKVTPGKAIILYRPCRMQHDAHLPASDLLPYDELYLPEPGLCSHSMDMLRGCLAGVSGLEALPIPEELATRTIRRGGRLAHVQTWALKSKHLDKVCISFLDSGYSLQYLAGTMVPPCWSDAPILEFHVGVFGMGARGAATREDKWLCSLDFVPMFENYEYTGRYVAPLAELRYQYRDICTAFPHDFFEAQRFASQGMLFMSSARHAKEANSARTRKQAKCMEPEGSAARDPGSQPTSDGLAQMEPRLKHRAVSALRQAIELYLELAQDAVPVSPMEQDKVEAAQRLYQMHYISNNAFVAHLVEYFGEAYVCSLISSVIHS
eukprot:jgi/Mesvir1/28700/Mv19671-RA.1